MKFRSSATLPILMLSLFFLFVSSFRNSSCSAVFIFCDLKKSCRISNYISAITSLFSNTKVSFYSNRSSCCTIWFILFILFPCLTCSMVFYICSWVTFSNLTLASYGFIFIVCLISDFHVDLSLVIYYFPLHLSWH